MNIIPEKFIKLLKEGKTEFELNRTESMFVDPEQLKLLCSKYEHTIKSATDYLTTDFTNGFTICKKCGTFYQLNSGFTKHLSNGCLHCEGEKKHTVYHVNASSPSEGGFPARWMAQYFDDGMSYCKDKAEINKYIKFF